MSVADVSVLNLALQLSCQLASDDGLIRSTAQSNNIPITGSLGRLKAMYVKSIIKGKKNYQKIISSLSEDVYLTEELLEWALDVQRSRSIKNILTLA